MAKLPSPGRLEDVEPELYTLRAGCELWRVYFRGGDFPTTWNQFRHYGPQPKSRFDHHPLPQRVHPAFGILYCAQKPITCMAEVFQKPRVIRRAFRSPHLAGFTINRDLTLLDLTGAWPTRAGASMNINSGPHPRARQWSQAIYKTYPNVEGIYYCSSMYANKPCIALYERAEDAIPKTSFFNRALSDPLLDESIAEIKSTIGYGEA